eukprot:TRINITY_DN22990_c0_g1_i1.p1 TRINITY_DN22990_c0_g1~~TRINITY_DN22990_c0_g1_i1.p1  ORF type:complete len:322 (+),score=71.76 TRINITY_DN22990_c0_g1_i1:398-1363(+)
MKREGCVRGNPSSKSRKPRKARTTESTACRNVGSNNKSQWKRGESVQAKGRRTKDWQSHIKFLIQEGKHDARCGDDELYMPCKRRVSSSQVQLLDLSLGDSISWHDDVVEAELPPLWDDEWRELSPQEQEVLPPEEEKDALSETEVKVVAKCPEEVEAESARAEDPPREEPSPPPKDEPNEAVFGSELAIINSLTEYQAGMSSTFPLPTLSISPEVGSLPSDLAATSDGTFDEISLAASIFATHPEYFRPSPRPTPAWNAWDEEAEGESGVEEELEEAGLAPEMESWEWLPSIAKGSKGNEGDARSPRASSWSVVDSEDGF